MTEPKPQRTIEARRPWADLEPEPVPDELGRHAGHNAEPEVLRWRENVFTDDMPVDQKLAFLREYVETLHENLLETLGDLRKVECKLKSLEKCPVAANAVQP